MLKFLVAVTFLFVAVSAQDDPDENEIEFCFDGSSTNGVGNFTMKPCSLSNLRDACQTRIHEHGNNTYLKRECTQRLSCRNQAANNPVDCYDEKAIGEVNRVCRFCCQTSGCNNFNTIAEQNEGEGEEEEGGDGDEGGNGDGNEDDGESPP